MKDKELKDIKELKELKEKISKGLKIAYKKMIAFKKEKKTPIIYMKGDKIVEYYPK
jgi:hypothetical protein